MNDNLAVASVFAQLRQHSNRCYAPYRDSLLGNGLPVTVLFADCIWLGKIDTTAFEFQMPFLNFFSRPNVEYIRAELAEDNTFLGMLQKGLMLTLCFYADKAAQT